MKMTTLFLVMAGIWLAATAAPGQTTGGQGTTNQGAVMQDTPAGTAPGARSTPLGDAEFVRRAVIANRFEIEEAQLAVAQGGDPRLKEFARTMVLDHGAALKDLEAAARAAGVTVPDKKFDEVHQAKINAISRKKGADFDQQYRADQRQAHDDAIGLLVAYQQSGKSEQLKAWAIKMLPVVRKHREAVGALNTR
jgi:putative membrane protein